MRNRADDGQFGPESGTPALDVIPRQVVDEREPRPEVAGVQHHNTGEALMAHRTARLNVFGRQLLVSRVELDGWSIAKAAEAQGVSRQTAHKWVTRYRSEGWPGLEDRTSRPHRTPRITPPETVEAILRARVERRWGPHRIVRLASPGIPLVWAYRTVPNGPGRSIQR